MNALFHDPCAGYAEPRVPEPNGTVRLSVRAAHGVTNVALAYTNVLFFATENDWAHVPCTPCGERNGFTFYAAELRVKEGGVRYRFTGLDAAGRSADTGAPFLLVPGFDTPDWSKRAVWYQIMPDSFYNGDVFGDKSTGGGVQENAWGNGHFGGNDYYGGDLYGIVQKLDYLQSLGVTAISLNPVWVATHQAGYGADDLTDVDSCFGGDGALVYLREGTRKRGMRLCLDGVFDYLVYKAKQCNRDGLYPLPGGEHENDPYYDWFLRDRAGNPIGSFWGHPLMDFSCDAYRDYAYRAPDSVVQTYLRPPYDIDAWRMDVGNIYEGSDPVHFGNAVDVMRDMRETIHAAGNDKLLITENDLPKMRAYGTADSKWNYELGTPLRDFAAGRISAQAFMQTAEEVTRGLPRPMAESCFNHVTTHDTERIWDTAGGKENAVVAATVFNMLFVGAPSIYYGDETGMRAQCYPHMGKAAPTSFAAMQWDSGVWNERLRRLYTVLGNLRSARADFFGSAGFETVYAEGDVLAFVRFTQDAFCLVACNRGDAEITAEIDCSAYAQNIDLIDSIGGQTVRVQNGHAVVRVSPGGGVFCPAGFAPQVLPPAPAADRMPYDDFTIEAYSRGEGGLCVAQNGLRLAFAASGGRLALSLGDALLGEWDCAGPVRLGLEKLGARYAARYSQDGTTWRYAIKNVHCNFSEYTAFATGDAENFRIGDGAGRRRDYKENVLSLDARTYAAGLAPARYRVQAGDFAYAYGGYVQQSAGRSQLSLTGTYTLFKASFTVRSDFAGKNDFAGLRAGDARVTAARDKVCVTAGKKTRTCVCDTSGDVPLTVTVLSERLLVTQNGRMLVSLPYTPSPCSLAFIGHGRYALKNVGVYREDIPFLVGRGTLCAMDEGWDLSSAGCGYAYAYALQPLGDFVLSANIKFNVSAGTFPDGYVAFNYGVKAGAYPEQSGVTVRLYKDGNRVEVAVCGTVTAAGVIDRLDCESFYLVLANERGHLRLYATPNEFTAACEPILETDTGMEEGGCLLLCAKNARMFLCSPVLAPYSSQAEKNARQNGKVTPSKHRYMI